jgi:hypothetical protein
MNKEQIKIEQKRQNNKLKFYQADMDYYFTEANKAQSTIDLIKSNLCFFQFTSHEEAEYMVEGLLQNKASNNCEGSNCCGQPEYTQEYQLIDSDAVYLGKIKVEYNRHDKTYYYVDEVEYSFSEVKS